MERPKRVQLSAFFEIKGGESSIRLQSYKMRVKLELTFCLLLPFGTDFPEAEDVRG